MGHNVDVELGSTSGGHLRRINGDRSIGKSGGLLRWVGPESYEAVPATRQRLNVARTVGIVCQRGANLGYAEVDSAVEVHERVVAPEAVLNFLPGDDLPGPFSKQQK